MKPATVSSPRFSEDAYAGVMTALHDVEWNNFGGRYVVLITDAGALKGNDPFSSTMLDAPQVKLEAQHRGVAIYAMHLKTPEGKANHAEDGARRWGTGLLADQAAMGLALLDVFEDQGFPAHLEA